MYNAQYTNAKKILIIGCPGSGKSTLSKRLSEQLKLPLYHLDMIWHNPDKTTRYKPEFIQIVSELIQQPQWIIDGNYKGTMEMRIKEADMIILLDLPTDVCLEGIRSRIGIQRDDLPWKEDTLDPEFEQYTKTFRDEQIPKIYTILDKYKGEKQICVLTSREEVNNFMR